MSAHAPKKLVWLNKFQVPAPSIANLKDGYPKPAHGVFDATRDALCELGGVSEAVAWHGVPWRWTLVYRLGEAPEVPGTRAFAYIIPDPARLQVCIPLTRDQVAVLPMRRFKKVVRDTIVFARTVAGVSWPTWDIPSAQALEDVRELLRRKHKLISAPGDAIAMEA